MGRFNTATDLPRVFFAEEDKLPWLALKDIPGFGGVDIPGVYGKFFGKEGRGPWFYLARHDPGTVVNRHTHRGDVFHYILEGEWEMGGRTMGPGTMHFEQKGLYYGPIVSGPKGSTFLAVYDHEPMFIERD
jgi:hypothetical protein